LKVSKFVKELKPAGTRNASSFERVEGWGLSVDRCVLLLGAPTATFYSVWVAFACTFTRN
jgi:hypothetical protein